MTLFTDGERINDRWLVERFIGEGAFSEVYRVRHNVLGLQAMKVLKRTGIGRDEVETLLSEAVLLAGLNHRHIIRVYDADTTEHDQGILGFFTTEYAYGGNLEAYWRRFGDRFMPIATVWSLFTQITEALAVAHGQNPPIVHRDITFRTFCSPTTTPISSPRWRISGWRKRSIR